MLKCIIVILSLTIFTGGQGQVGLNIVEILTDLDKYYSQKRPNGIYFNFKQTFKSAIAEDTVKLEANLYKNDTAQFNYIIEFLNTNRLVERTIYIDSKKNLFYEFSHMNKLFYKQKFTSADGYLSLIKKTPSFKQIPFGVLKMYKLRDENKYIFSTPQRLLTVSKNYDTTTFQQHVFSSLGVEYLYEKAIFHISPKSVDSLLLTQYNYFISNYTLESNVKDKDEEINYTSPIPDSILNLMIDTSKTATTQYYLVDFFYQSCLPCIKFFDQIKQVFEDSVNFKSLKIIGIDPVLSDTLNMKKFCKRYNLNYKIIMGSIANEIVNYFSIHVYPTTILFTNKGEILLKKKGYYSNLLKVLRKIIK